MNEQITVFFSIHEVCETTRLSPEMIIGLIEHGVISPESDSADALRFSTSELSLIRRAARLHHELDVGWDSMALVLELIEERDALRTELTRLRQRLLRFESE